jgi:hypothetical protein
MNKKEFKKLMDELQQAAPSPLEIAFNNLLKCREKDQKNLEGLARLSQKDRERRKGCHICPFYDRCPGEVKNNANYCPARGMNPEWVLDPLSDTSISSLCICPKN